MAKTETPTAKTYIDAYNEYLKTHNKVETASIYPEVNGTVYAIDADMFIEYLVSQIALQVVNASEFINPLDGLYKGEVRYGKIIQDIRTICGYKEKDYNVKDFANNVTNPYEKEKPGVVAVYHKINNEKVIKVTTTYEQLLSAFQTENGLNALVASIINDISVQKAAWEYNEMKETMEKRDYATVLRVKDFADFSVKVKNIFTDFTFFDNSHKYNRSVIPSPTAKSNIKIIMSKKYQNEVDVNYFTGLFNVSYAEIKENIMYVDEFTNPKRVCMIVDERGLFFYKVIDVSRNLENPADLTRNIWLHFWRLLSVSPNYNAVAIELEDSEDKIPYITVDTTDYKSEENLYFVGQKTVTINANGASDVTYKVNGGAATTVTGTATVNVTSYSLIQIFVGENEKAVYAVRII